MPKSFDDNRIPPEFTQKLEKAYGQQFEAARSCLRVAIKVMQCKPTNDLQRLTGLFLQSLTNSLVAAGVLCSYGHGGDSIRIARGTFEVLVKLEVPDKKTV